MPEGRTLAVSRLRAASVGLSVAALAVATLAVLAMGMFPFWSRVAVLIVPVVLGAIALVLAIRSRGFVAARPGSSIALMMSVLAIVAPAVTISAVIIAGFLAPSVVYRLTVDSPEPVSVVIRDGATTTRAEWASGDTIVLDSSATVIGIGAQTSTATTVISCEITRGGNILRAEERAGSVDCSFIDGRE